MVHPFVTYYVQGLIAYGVLLFLVSGVVQIRRKKIRSGLTLLGIGSLMLLAMIGVRILRIGM